MIEPRSHWRGSASPDEIARWDDAAALVAERLAVDALERDRANQDPTRELDLLRESGLLHLLDPVEAGGGGGHWESAFRAVRIIARADASIAQVLAYHYANVASLVFTDATDRLKWYRRSVEGRWVWGDSVNPTDPDLVLSVEQDAYRLNGLKRFSTGASSGDVILVNALVQGGDDDGTILSFVLDHDRRGISYLGDWDALGQRLSASGSVRFADVVVTRADILGKFSDTPFASLLTPGIQLAFSNLYLGVAQGALARGVELVRHRRGSWFLSGVDAYRDDPFVKRTVGELSASIAAVEALADRVGRRFDEVIGLGSAVTVEERGTLAIEVAQLKVVSSDTSIDVTNRVFEVTGSSSARSEIGLDLYWRNVRTHSLHDPVDYKKLEVGDWELNARTQRQSLYT